MKLTPSIRIELLAAIDSLFPQSLGNELRAMIKAEAAQQLPAAIHECIVTYGDSWVAYSEFVKVNGTYFNIGTKSIAPEFYTPSDAVLAKHAEFVATVRLREAANDEASTFLSRCSTVEQFAKLCPELAAKILPKLEPDAANLIAALLKAGLVFDKPNAG